MKNKNKKFRVELGLNLHSAPIPQTNPNMRIFPLQNALVDVTDGEQAAKPAWYSRLGPGDEISFRLVDISDLRVPVLEPDYPRFALAEFYFNDPATAQPANPFTEEIVAWRISGPHNDQPSPVYSMAPDQGLPTWELVGLNHEGEEHPSMRFAECGEHLPFRAFELAVVVKMVRDGWVNHYVFDPEMIVSEIDNEGK